MGATTLPPEVLHTIFSNLYGLAVIRCRAVCKSWKAAVDSLRNSQWKQVCENGSMYSVYEKIHSKSSIPWVDVYRAVNSWSHVKTAEVSCRVLPATAQKFKLLPNRMIAVLTTSNGSSASGNKKGQSDTIIYYDVDTLQELKRDQYDKPIIKYNENEHLIVLLSSDGELTLIKKKDNKKTVVGKVFKQYGSYHVGFGLFGKKVYYQDKDSLICISKLKETKTGALIIRNAPLRAFDENYDSFEPIAAYGYMEGKLTLITDDGHVTIYENEDFGMLSKLRSHTLDIIGEMEEFGFDWTSPELYKWLTDRYGQIRISNIDHHHFILHGKVGFVGSSKGCIVHIFYYPFNSNGNLSVYNASPTRSINLKKVPGMPDGLKDNPITQIDVMESADHHLVFVLTGERVFILNIGFHGTKELEY